MLLLPTLHMSQYHQGGPSDHISRDGILLNTIPIPASSCSHNLCTCRSAHMIMQIITGGHSTSGKEMQIIVSLLQSTKDGLSPWHGVLLLQIPWGMLKEQDPAVCLELSGKDSVTFNFEPNQVFAIALISYSRLGTTDSIKLYVISLVYLYI